MIALYDYYRYHLIQPLYKLSLLLRSTTQHDFRTNHTGNQDNRQSFPTIFISCLAVAAKCGVVAEISGANRIGVIHF